MEHLKKAVSQWQNLNAKYKKDTQQHFQRAAACLRTYWALDMKEHAEEIKESIRILGKLRKLIQLLTVYLRKIYRRI